MLNIFSTYFDRRCPACGNVTGWGKRGNKPLLCPACLEELSPQSAGFCRLCGLPFAPGSRSLGPCPDCLLQKPPWSHFLCIGPYEGLLRRLILGLKFHSALHAADILGSLLAERLKSGEFGSFDLVTAVPLHLNRLQQRGYNQSLEIAKRIGRELRAPVYSGALVRIRHGPPQETLSREERKNAVKGAFVARNACLKRVLLVDDVMTTGATVDECCRALLDAGAAEVTLAVAARTRLFKMNRSEATS